MQDEMIGLVFAGGQSLQVYLPFELGVILFRGGVVVVLLDYNGPQKPDTKTGQNKI